MNQEVRSTLEQLKNKLYPSTQPTEKQMERKQSITQPTEKQMERKQSITQPTPAIPSIPTAELFERMSVSKAAKHCLSLKIDKPSAIHRLTGKPIDQIYTALWSIRNNTKKAKAVVKKAEPTKAEHTNKKDQKYITFLENALAKSHETRNVTSEVTEVMEEVMKLRATVAYLESKLFGGK